MDNLFLPEEFETSTIGEKPDTDATEWVLIEPEETAPPAETPAQEAVEVVAGEDRLVPGQVGFGSWETAWTRLQDFHRRATGYEGELTTAIANELSQEEAFAAYSNAATLLTGQFIVIGPEAQLEMFNSLNEFALGTGSLDGLDSFFLNGAHAAQLAGDTAALERAAAVLGQTGFPAVLGGGGDLSVLFDSETGRLSLPDMGQIRDGFGPAGDALFDLSGAARPPSEVLEALTSLYGTNSPSVFGGFDGLFGDGPTVLNLDEDMAWGSEDAERGAKVGREIGVAAGSIAKSIADHVPVPGAHEIGTSIADTLADIGESVGFIVGAVIGLFKSDTPAPAEPAPAPHDAHPAPAPHDAHPAPGPQHPPGGEAPGGSTPHPSGPQPPQGSGGGAHKCWEPDMSTGLPAFDGDSGEGGGGGLNWFSSGIPDGPGLDGLSVHLGGNRFQMPNLPGMDAEGRLQRPGFLTNFGYEIIPPGEGLDDHEFLENPASVLTITDDIDSPDPVSGEIDEAPV